MGTVLYSICAALVVLTLVIFLAVKKKYTSSLYSVMYILMIVASLGYIALGLSTELNEAFIATKIVYVGGCFIPVVMLMILSRFIKFKYHNILAGVAITTAFVLYSFVLTIGYSDLYYVREQCAVYHNNIMNVSFVSNGAKGEGYGPAHVLFSIYIGTYMAINIGFLVYGFFKSHSVSYKSLLYMVIIIVLTMIVSLFSDNLFNGFDIMPFGYAISGIVMLMLIIRLNDYDMSQLANINLDNKEYYGCIAFDDRKNFLGCNEIALNTFTEIKNLMIDMQMPNEYPYDKITRFINEYDNNNLNNETNFERGGRIYKFQISRFLTHHIHKKGLGYFIEITDDTKQVEYINLLNNYSNQLEIDVNKKTEEVKRIQHKIVLSLADMVESRDESTGGHVKRTSDTVEIILESIKKLNVYDVDDKFYRYVRRAAPMHDLGKISIKDEILNKPGKFTPEEYEIMKTHSAIGEKMVGLILDDIEDPRFVQITKNVARFHHEKYGGGGYPDNLFGEDIPIEARIMALADVYDALVSKRVYKEKMSYQKARQIIEESMGPHFDPKLALVFEDARLKLERYYDSLE